MTPRAAKGRSPQFRSSSRFCTSRLLAPVLSLAMLASSTPARAQHQSPDPGAQAQPAQPADSSQRSGPPSERPLPPETSPPSQGRAVPSTPEASRPPVTAAEQGQAQATGPGQAAQSMEGVQVDPRLERKPLNRLQIAGWTSLLSGLALGAGASALLNGAQTSEGSAQRVLRRFNEGTGAHAVYEQVRVDYNRHLNRAAVMRSSALALTITAGVAFLTGATLAIIGATRRKRSGAPPTRGLSFRF